MHWCVNDSEGFNNTDYPELKVIGITGGIGSGKSVVSRILRCNGYTVYDCDMQAKILMNEHSSLKKRLYGILGKNAYCSDGKINRAYVSEKIFNDFDVRRKVNVLVHSEVRNHISTLLEIHKGLFFIESAIPATGGLIPLCDAIWNVESPLQLRIDRVKKRDSITKEDIEKKIKSQEKEFSLLPSDKTAHILNDGKKSLIIQIINLLNKNYKRC